MMNKFALTSLCAAVALGSPLAFGDAVVLNSHVDNVTVFPNGASIHRAGHARLQTGEHQVIFAGLPANLTDDTIRIGGFGPGATVESVSIRPGRLAEITGPSIERLAEQLSAAEHAAAEATRRQTELTARRELLTRTPNGAAQIPTLDNELRLATAQTAALTSRAQGIRQALAQARADGERTVKFVTVDLSSIRDGDLDLTIEYMVPTGAVWRPSYAAHLDAQGARVGLDMFATVQQQTGEDWDNIHLSVSTVVPNAGLALPSFEEQSIELEDPPEPAERAVRARPMAQGDDAFLSMRPAVAANGGIAMPAPPPMPVRPPPAPVEQIQGDARPHLLSARLEIPTPVSIRSGAPPRRVLAAHTDATSSIEYQAAPRQSNSVFLAARFRNDNAFPFLRGDAALFIGSDYVGTSALNDVPIGEDLLLPFGVDAGVTIDRTQAERVLTQHDGRDDTTLRFAYRVSNHRTRAATITVFDQIPVSHSQGLTVHPLSPDRPVAPRHEGDAPGTIRWQIQLDPGATVRWTAGYVVSAPHRRAVTGATE